MGCWSVHAAVSPSEPEFANSTPASVLRCLQARYIADTFYTNAGCTLVAMNPFKPVPQLYSPELMQEYHAASQPQVRPPASEGIRALPPPCRHLAALLSLSVSSSAMLSFRVYWGSDLPTRSSQKFGHMPGDAK